jgi:hypothetical protein
MKLALIIATLVNIVSCSANVAMVYSNFIIARGIEHTERIIRDTWSENHIAIETIRSHSSQIEKDLIRIRQYARKESKR